MVGELPWKQVKVAGRCRSRLAKVYFERVYGIWSPTKYKDALLAVASAGENLSSHQELFETLEWDGIERLDTILIDYLGAKTQLLLGSYKKNPVCCSGKGL